MRELDKMIGERLGMTERSARVIRLGFLQEGKVKDEKSKETMP
jgi:hypothetical protein